MTMFNSAVFCNFAPGSSHQSQNQNAIRNALTCALFIVEGPVTKNRCKRENVCQVDAAASI
eukprot:5504036-Amphidinium_carterae.1